MIPKTPFWRGLSGTNSGGRFAPGRFCSLPTVFFRFTPICDPGFLEYPDLSDDRQITHLICVRLRHLLYDFFRGCFGPLYI